ncbi:MAG: ribbon-helix-helix protein, CopG family [Cereibacter sp.]
MPKIRVTVTLDKEIEDWLRAGSISSGSSLSELIRRALKEYRMQNPQRFLRGDKSRSASDTAWLRRTDKVG